MANVLLRSRAGGNLPEESKDIPVDYLVVFVVDCSHSTSNFSQDMASIINGIIQNLYEISEAESTFLSMICFSDKAQIMFDTEPLLSMGGVLEFNHSRGSRLYENLTKILHDTVDYLREHFPIPPWPSVVVVLLTDGQDNLSAPGALYDLRRIVGQLEEANFVLMTIGVGICGKKIAREIGFPVKIAQSFGVDKKAIWQPKVQSKENQTLTRLGRKVALINLSRIN